jgi:hypothetical protein
MKTYKIGKIEVLGFDLPSQTQNEVTYHQAWEGMASSEYRHGWRMPTIEEMKYLLMFQVQYSVLGVNVDRPYWTSEYDTQGATASIAFIPANLLISGDPKVIFNKTSMYNLYPVRFVRDI